MILAARRHERHLQELSRGAPARLSTLVDYLTTTFPNALVVVAEIIPYPSQPTNANPVQQLDRGAWFRSKVSAGKHVAMVDLNTGFHTSTMLASDAIHPNQNGYDWMGDTGMRPSAATFRDRQSVDASREALAPSRSAALRRKVFVAAWPFLARKSRERGRFSGSPSRDDGSFGRGVVSLDHREAVRASTTRFLGHLGGRRRPGGQPRPRDERFWCRSTIRPTRRSGLSQRRGLPPGDRATARPRSFSRARPAPHAGPPLFHRRPGRAGESNGATPTTNGRGSGRSRRETKAVPRWPGRWRWRLRFRSSC